MSLGMSIQELEQRLGPNPSAAKIAEVLYLNNCRIEKDIEKAIEKRTKDFLDNLGLAINSQ